jgi:hypothetical protein
MRVVAPARGQLEIPMAPRGLTSQSPTPSKSRECDRGEGTGHSQWSSSLRAPGVRIRDCGTGEMGSFGQPKPQCAPAVSITSHATSTE